MSVGTAQKVCSETEYPTQSGNPAQSGTATLPDQELTVVQYIRENDICTTSIVAELLNVKDRRARGILGGLVKKDILKKAGNARNTIYQAGKCFPDEE